MGIPTHGYGFSVPSITATSTAADIDIGVDDGCSIGPEVTLARGETPAQEVHVSWGLRPSSLNPENFSFTLQRSMSPGFRSAKDFKILSGPKVGMLSYDDLEISFEDSYRSWYYRVVATSLESASIEFVSPIVRLNTSEEAETDPITRELRYRMAVELTRLNGVRCAVFLMKSYGPRCHFCFDEAVGRATTDNCERCYRTTFLGGYYLPIPRYVRFAPAPKRVDLDLRGKEHRTFVTGICEHSPILRPGDLIKNLATDEVWDVASLEPPTSRRGAIIHQNPVLYLLTHGDVERRVAGDVDFESLCAFKREEWQSVLI